MAVLINHGIVTEGRDRTFYYVNGPGDCLDLPGASRRLHSIEANTITPVSLYVAPLDALAKIPEWKTLAGDDSARKRQRNERYLHAVQQSSTMPRAALAILEFFEKTNE